MTNLPSLESPLSRASYFFEPTCPQMFTNTSHPGAFSPDSNDINDRTPRSLAFSASLKGEIQNIAAGPLDSNGKHNLLHTNVHKAAVRSAIYQDSSSETILPPVPIFNETHSAQAAHRYEEPLRVNNTAHDSLDRSQSATPHNSDVMAQHSLQKNAEEIPYPIDVTEQHLQRSTHMSFSRATDVLESDIPSRPQSRRSNCGKAMVRPVPAHELQPQGVPDAHSQRGALSSKVKKSISVPNNTAPSDDFTHASVTEQGQQKSRSTQKFFTEYKKFLETGQECFDALQEYERQGQLLDAKKIELERLQNTHETSIVQINALELEKAELRGKLKKFEELSSKYRIHINEVVKTQKYLKTGANEMQQQLKAVREEAEKVDEAAIEACDQQMAVLKKLQDKIRIVKRDQLAQGEYSAYMFGDIDTVCNN